MADYGALADLLAETYGQGPAPPPASAEDRYPYGKPRFPNLDPRAYFDPGTRQAYGEEPWGSDAMNIAPWALMGLRAPTAMGSMRPFNPQAPKAPLPKRPDTAIESGNGLPQHVYEALLGRTRKPGQDVADPGSGWWHVGGQPIPKPSNVLPWLGAGAVGYGIWRGLGGPETTREMQEQPWMVPGTPEYEERWARYPDDPQYMGNIAQIDAQHVDRKLAKRLGIAGWSPISDLFSLALSPDQQAELEKRRLPGGMGNAPY